MRYCTVLHISLTRATHCGHKHLEGPANTALSEHALENRVRGWPGGQGLQGDWNAYQRILRWSLSKAVVDHLLKTAREDTLAQSSLRSFSDVSMRNKDYGQHSSALAVLFSSSSSSMEFEISTMASISKGHGSLPQVDSKDKSTTTW